MLRPATPADLPHLLAIRDAAGADALSDPALVDAGTLARLVAARSVSAWEGCGCVVGFAAMDGATIHLLVEPNTRGTGVGRNLLASACAALKAAGHPEAMLNLPAGGSAARHYRAAGWLDASPSATGGLALKKPL